LSKNQRFGVALIFCNVSADAGFEFDGELTHLYIRSYTERGRKEAATVFSKVETIIVMGESNEILWYKY
jgi:hypothetical protein